MVSKSELRSSSVKLKQFVSKSSPKEQRDPMRTELLPEFLGIFAAVLRILQLGKS